jgi:aminoglycoside 6'-N-acetyltransferase I
MRTALWADQTEADMRRWLTREDAVTLVATGPDGKLVGFAEAGERSWAEGAVDGPVAYLEGWYIEPEARGMGVGAALVYAVEEWARARGYRDLCSDTAPGNIASQRAHERLGFAEVDRAVLYHKSIRSPADG